MLIKPLFLPFRVTMGSFFLSKLIDYKTEAIPYHCSGLKKAYVCDHSFFNALDELLGTKARTYMSHFIGSIGGEIRNTANKDPLYLSTRE